MEAVNDQQSGSWKINKTIPSLVTNNSYVYCFDPSGEDVVREENHSEEDSEKKALEDDSEITTGKWMMFLDKSKRDSDGLTELDREWFKVRKLVKSNFISHARCSTARDNPTARNRTQGVILCFTENYNDQIQVKKAADAIQSVINFDGSMFYKTDRATSQNLYKKHGNTRISLYKHDVNGVFYIKDDCTDNKTWKQIIDIDINVN